MFHLAVSPHTPGYGGCRSGDLPQGSHSQPDNPLPHSQSYDVGARVSYVCHSGYTASDPSHLYAQCRPDGWWHPGSLDCSRNGESGRNIIVNMNRGVFNVPDSYSFRIVFRLCPATICMT